jgi:hypothetical protein
MQTSGKTIAGCKSFGRFFQNNVFKIERFTVKFFTEPFGIGNYQYDGQLTSHSNVNGLRKEGDMIPPITFFYVAIAHIADYPVAYEYYKAYRFR